MNNFVCAFQQVVWTVNRLITTSVHSITFRPYQISLSGPELGHHFLASTWPFVKLQAQRVLFFKITVTISNMLLRFSLMCILKWSFTYR